MALREYIVEEVALDCAEGRMPRREALRRLGLLGVSGAAAMAVLAACGGSDSASDATTATSSAPATGATAGSAPTTAASAATTAPAGAPAAPATTAAPAAATAAPAGAGGEIRFPGPNGEVIGVLGREASPRGAVLVIHENRGLTPHIRTIPGRLAADGYTALAIDLLSAEGGTAGLPSEGDATAALGNAPPERLVADLRAGLDELERQAPGAALAVIGFCFGGGMTWQLLAAGEPRLAAAVPFYGPFTAGSSLAGSPNAAVLGVYAGLDTPVNASLEAARSALTAASLTHELRVFDGVDHAFFNDTGPRYNAPSAAAAYDAMLAWFTTHLS